MNPTSWLKKTKQALKHDVANEGYIIYLVRISDLNSFLFSSPNRASADRAVFHCSFFFIIWCNSLESILWVPLEPHHFKITHFAMLAYCSEKLPAADALIYMQVTISLYITQSSLSCLFFTLYFV
jgi:hypothetical protein